MSNSDGVKNIYSQLQSYEESVLGFLMDPGADPDFVTDLLAVLNTEGLEQELLRRLGHNGSFVESEMQALVDKVNAVRRDYSVRTMTRSQYYEDAAVERQEEIQRQNRKKIEMLQHLLGNSPLQTG